MRQMISKMGIAAAAGLGAAACLAYHCYSPTSQFYGRTLCRIPDPRALALTYDDGPNDSCTERLLAVLAEHDVKATFFLIGRFVQARAKLARAIADSGHPIGNHTYSHPNLLFLSRKQLRRELSDCSKAIADAVGFEPRFFRPPFGARRHAVLDEAREAGLEPVMWNVTCFDWKVTTATAVETHARKQIDGKNANGHIVLLHDGGHSRLGMDRNHTVQATERLITRYKEHYYFTRIDNI